MTNICNAEPLTKVQFEPFGDVIETASTPDKLINEGKCARFHDLATLDFTDARGGISLFKAHTYAIPHILQLMERHPLGSQTFLPMTDDPFLVIVAADHDNAPGRPKVFITNGEQGVNYYRNTWHGVLTPIGGSGLFAVVDRIGEGDNLQEYRFEKPYRILL